MVELELCAVGGYTEVGKNMSALRVGDEVILIDMGVSVQAISNYDKEEGSTKVLSSHQLMDIGAIPDDRKIEDWKPLVKAIVLGHAHYDHIAAVQFLAAKYKCPIIGTPFTIKVLKAILDDDEIKLPNKFIVVEPDEKYKISDNLTV